MVASEKSLMGISLHEWQKIVECVLRCPNVIEIIIYGSRAKNNYREFSDIDITLKGENLKHTDLFQIYNDLDDLLLPYMIDLSIFSEIDNPALLEEINRHGVSLLPLLSRNL